MSCATGKTGRVGARSFSARSHAPRGNAYPQSLLLAHACSSMRRTVCIPTRSVGKTNETSNGFSVVPRLINHVGLNASPLGRLWERGMAWGLGGSGWISVGWGARGLVRGEGIFGVRAKWVRSAPCAFSRRRAVGEDWLVCLPWFRRRWAMRGRRGGLGYAVFRRDGASGCCRSGGRWERLRWRGRWLAPGLLTPRLLLGRTGPW